MPDPTDFHGFEKPSEGKDPWSEDYYGLLDELDARIELRGTLAERPSSAPDRAVFIVDDPGSDDDGKVFIYDESSGSWGLASRRIADGEVESLTVNQSDHGGVTSARRQFMPGQGRPFDEMSQWSAMPPDEFVNQGTIFTDDRYNALIWPAIMRADVFDPNPTKKWYCYYSGYRTPVVRLAHSDSLTEGWEQHPDSPVFDHTLDAEIDDFDLASIHPVYDPGEDRLWVYAHTRENYTNSADQVSFVVSSPNGRTNWSYDGRIMDLPTDSSWDATERAYLRPYRIQNSFVGIYMGRNKELDNWAVIGFAWSPNGKPGTWRTFDRPLFDGRHPKFNPTEPATSKAGMFNLNGQPYLFINNPNEPQALVGPWFGPNQATLDAMEQWPIGAGNRFFSHDGYLWSVYGSGSDINLNRMSWSDI